MSKPFTKDEVIHHKKQAIQKINSLLEMYINSSDARDLKKANLLSYWLESFSDYVRDETKFNPQALISYKRGDIIKLNFGFNVGSEHGGLHYAIVLDNDNLHSSPVVTVIPLSSGTADTTYKRDVFLGQELYIKLNAKNKSLLKNAKQKYDENEKMFSDLRSIIYESGKDEITNEQAEKIYNMTLVFKEKADELNKDIEMLEKYQKEISHMKQGSIALMEQLTTVSKMRIYVPKKSTDTLYGISFSAEAMEKINTQLANLYFKT